MTRKNFIKKHPVKCDDKRDIKINAFELAAGMYLYALIVDGKEIDVKRMVLTD